jgi:hypothetical protein
MNHFLIIFLLACATTCTAQSFSTDFSCDFDAPCGEVVTKLPIASKTCTFSVFPNPTVDILMIEPPPQYVRVFDVVGRDVGDMRVVRELSQGIYFVEIKMGNCRETRKFIKL